MLKRFFLNALSSFLGAWVALALFGLVAVVVVAGLIARMGLAQQKEQSVSKESVMVINLTGEILENDVPVDFDYSSFLSNDILKKQTLLTLTQAIEAAAENENVEAIYLKCGILNASPATLNALRNSLIKFKSSGKKIIAYGDVLTMSDYYVATVADDLCLNPGGNVTLQGLGGISLFFKGLLDKLGIEVQMVKVGTFKSAVEPYISTEMSGPARAQLDTLYGYMWDFMLNKICESRQSLTPEKINLLINNDFIFLKKGEKDLAEGLVDHLYYERSMDSVIAASLGKEKKNLNFVDPSLLVSQEDFEISPRKDRIAVLFASGEILDGGGNSTINFERFVPIIASLADDDQVKGMVLRVNSPGGSVFGSEQIGEALDYFQSKGKPLAVSMGDYAASGGYWISCHANRIFADPLTITGSIGIFGLVPNAEGLLKKLGLNTEIVSTNPGAMFPTLVKAMDPKQLAAMQVMVEDGYNSFVKRVATGRHLSEERVRQIGEGRVWSAQKAMEIGLVDSLGNLHDAIDWVSENANLSNYGVVYYPKYKISVWDYLPEILELQQQVKLAHNTAYDLPVGLYLRVYHLLNQYPIQARMPEIKVGFNPERKITL